MRTRSYVLSALCALNLLAANSVYAENPVVGAMIGGSTGALIGHSMNGRDGALIGGALGAFAGAAIASNNGYTGVHYPYPPAPPATYYRPRVAFVNSPPAYQQEIDHVWPYRYGPRHEQHHWRHHSTQRDDRGNFRHH